MAWWILQQPSKCPNVDSDVDSGNQRCTVSLVFCVSGPAPLELWFPLSFKSVCLFIQIYLLFYIFYLFLGIWATMKRLYLSATEFLQFASTHRVPKYIPYSITTFSFQSADTLFLSKTDFYVFFCYVQWNVCFQTLTGKYQCYWLQSIKFSSYSVLSIFTCFFTYVCFILEYGSHLYHGLKLDL